MDIQCLIKNDPDFIRIRAEEAGLEAQALAAAKSGTLDPFHAVETLGELEIFDPNLSVNKNLACSYCHDPAAGYGNGASILSVFTGGANPGSVPITNHGKFPDNRMAKRNPQTYVYSPYVPPLQYNVTQGDFYGGNFWDARATGYRLQNSAAEQGQDPPVDPEEMANPDSACVVWKLSLSNYKFFFEQVWGTGSLEIAWPANVNTVCSTPKGAAVFGTNATPLTLSPSERTRAQQAFDEFAQAIASYDSPSTVSPFTSKFDGFPCRLQYPYRARTAWLCTFQRQSPMQYLPHRRQIQHGHGNRHWCSHERRSVVHRLYLQQHRPAEERDPPLVCGKLPGSVGLHGQIPPV